MKQFNIELAQQLAEHIYYGVSFAEAAVLLELNEAQKRDIALDLRYNRVVCAAKARAKLDLLKATLKLALDVNGENPAIAFQAQRQLLMARFGVTHQKAELQLKSQQHKELMAFKEKSLKQWADVQTTKMVADAGIQTLTAWQDVPTKEAN